VEEGGGGGGFKLLKDVGTGAGVGDEDGSDLKDVGGGGGFREEVETLWVARRNEAICDFITFVPDYDPRPEIFKRGVGGRRKSLCQRPPVSDENEPTAPSTTISVVIHTFQLDSAILHKICRRPSVHVLPNLSLWSVLSNSGSG